MDQKIMLSTREIATFLNINEKMVYSLISDKGLPATKITGKWLFPRYLVEQWLENETINYPKTFNPVHPCQGLLVITGSNDILLDRMISLFNRLHSEHVAVFGNIGSAGGIKALKNNLCHIAASHLMQDDEQEYNFDFTSREFEKNPPALVNFCKREQGLIITKENPLSISGISDLDQKGLKIANRPKGTGTRLLLDKELSKAGLNGSNIKGYEQVFMTHMDVALQVLSGSADTALAIKPVASLLNLKFIPLRQERFDLLISKDFFFEKKVQMFLELLHKPKFHKIADELDGYDLSLCGKVVFPNQINPTR